MIELQNRRFEFVNYDFRPDSYWSDESDRYRPFKKCRVPKDGK